MIKETAQTAAVQVGKLNTVRIRPLTEKDRAQPRFANSNSGDVLRAHEKHVQIVSQNKLFTYDHVFSSETQQGDIFIALGQRPVYKFVEGYNVTMLAYGQTSSGKTYTMGTAQHDQQTNPEGTGIIPRAMSLLFELLQQKGVEQPPAQNQFRSIRPVSQMSNKYYRYSVKVSFVEIYNEELIDLLNSAPPHEKPPVTIREDTKGHIYWTGVSEVSVKSTEDVLYYLQQGTENRATGSTDMNEKSSRSHAIFSVTLKQEKFVPSSNRTASPAPSKVQSPKQQRLAAIGGRSSNNSNNGEEGEWVITASKFHFVDLAGSERLKRTAAEGDRRKEGININAGLLALGNVISALGDPSKKGNHVPYRDSKLTRLLQDSLGGNAMTLMIACVSPAESNLAETMNTLQYANRARNIKNKMEKNEMEEWMTNDNLDFLRSTIAKLKTEIRKSNNTPNNNTTIPTKMQIPTTDNRLLSDFSDDFSSTSSPLANPDFDELYHDQNIMIADLQQIVEELKKSKEFTEERNRVVEEELERLHQDPNNSGDFQKMVEPVIEEYEKTLSGYESQIVMLRAALNHAEHVYEEELDKIKQNELIIENQDKTIAELKKRMSKLSERQQKDQTYIAELEKKLMATVQESVQDREMMLELRGKILKLKEVDESTESYIRDLEARLNASEEERLELKTKIEDLVKDAKESTLISNLTNESVSLDQQPGDKSEDGKINEINVLRGKYDNCEQQRHELQMKLEQLLSEKATETRRSHEGESKRVHELESELANLRHDHQDTMKELDEVLLRYQEALEHADALQSVQEDSMNNQYTPSDNNEILLLRDKIKYLEHELKIKTQREKLFRQMQEDHKTDKLEASGKALRDQSDENTLFVQNFSTLQRQFENLKMEAQLQFISQEDIFEHKMTLEELWENYETQAASYRQESKNISRILKEVRGLKANETKPVPEQADTEPTSIDMLRKHSEYRVLLENISTLDNQLSEQSEKIRIDIKKFTDQMIEMLTATQELKDAVNIDNNTDVTSPELKQYEEMRSAIQMRLSIARQDLMVYKTTVLILENKTKNAEITLMSYKKHTENRALSVTDIEMEELMIRMDAMKLQLESNERSDMKQLPDV
ncbi:hypothetical protein G6F56_001702 [Rhizopus delemar]|nr:hypothetical protein G6F56_001702 [Rhizopus delemar]